jgi:hypothetical protein
MDEIKGNRAPQKDGKVSIKRKQITFESVIRYQTCLAWCFDCQSNRCTIRHGILPEACAAVTEGHPCRRRKTPAVPWRGPCFEIDETTKELKDEVNEHRSIAALSNGIDIPKPPAAEASGSAVVKAILHLPGLSTRPSAAVVSSLPSVSPLITFLPIQVADNPNSATRLARSTEQCASSDCVKEAFLPRDQRQGSRILASGQRRQCLWDCDIRGIDTTD